MSLHPSYRVFWIDNLNNNRCYEVTVDLFSQATIHDCIIRSLKLFNNQFKKMELNFDLLENPDLYDLYLAKKNGHPKSDFPG
jgi:hypothetical protein